jgi:trehalose 6-phosphate phosphatase
MQYLFQLWHEFSNEYRNAPHVLLLSDYDGTLTPIVGRPQDAVMPPGMRDKLSALARKPTVSVGIISGREMAELKGLVDIGGIYYAGNHGLEMEGPGLSYINPQAEGGKALINDLAKKLAAALDSIDGVIIEDKGLSLSVHYRLVKDDSVDMVTDTFEKITSPLRSGGRIKITTGKKVLEVRPPLEWHKGKAMEVISGEIKTIHKLDNILTIYLGDDVTDEDAFKVLRPPEGWSIFIGTENTKSQAEFYLNSTSEVEDFLLKISGIK